MILRPRQALQALSVCLSSYKPAQNTRKSFNDREITTSGKSDYGHSGVARGTESMSPDTAQGKLTVAQLFTEQPATLPCLAPGLQSTP